MGILPKEVPSFLDNRYYSNQGIVHVDQYYDSIIDGLITFEGVQWKFRLTRHKRFFLELSKSETKPGPNGKPIVVWVPFDKVSCPEHIDWRPKRGITLLLAAMVIRAFGRSEPIEDGIEVRCHQIEESGLQQTEIKTKVRFRLVARMPRLRPWLEKQQVS